MIPAKEFEGELWIKAADFHWQKKKWVGLTNEEIREGNKNSWVTKQAWESAVWWAEAKLKEKNSD